MQFGSSGTTVDSLVHKTVVGQPLNTTTAVSLHAEEGAGNLKQNRYAIEYPFKYGYKYKIEIYCNTPSQSPRPLLSRNLTSGTTANNCAGSEIASNPGGTVTAPEYADTVLWEIEPTQNYSRLEIGAVPNSAQISDRYIFVYWVKISVVDYPTFTLSPASLPIACGSTTNQTFTVGNTFNVNDIVSYVWSLPANNGWDHAMAGQQPTTINTGTTGSLTLTPRCGEVQQDVTVTITFGTGYAYTRSYTADVSTNPLSVSINGSSTICSSSQSYTLTGAPCSATVTWTGMNSNVTPSSPATGNPISITKVNNTSFTLTGSVTACGSTANATKLIYVGPPTAVTAITQEDVTVHCHVSFYKFTAVGGDRATNFDWTYTHNSLTNAFGLNARTANFGEGDGSCDPITIQVNATNACSTAPNTFQVNSDLCAPYDDPNCSGLLANTDSSELTLYPNPATNSFSIALKSETDKLQKLKDIRYVIIYDRFGQKLMQQNFGQGKRSIQLNISMLRPDIYTVLVSDGVKSSTVKFLKN
jgi:hypothetical protein